MKKRILSFTMALSLALSVCLSMATPASAISRSSSCDTNPHTYFQYSSDGALIVNDKNELWAISISDSGTQTEKLANGIKEIAKREPEGYLALKTDNTLVLRFWGGGLIDYDGSILEIPDVVISTEAKAIIGGLDDIYFINTRDELCCYYYSNGEKHVAVIDDNVRIGTPDTYYIKNDGSLWTIGGSSYLEEFISEQVTVTVGGKQKTMSHLSGFGNVKWFGGNSATTLVLCEDGTLWGWGTSTQGQLGVYWKDYKYREHALIVGGNMSDIDINDVPDSKWSIEIQEPVKILEGVDRVFTYDAGRTHVVTEDGRVISWGGEHYRSNPNSYEHKQLSDMQWLADVAMIDNTYTSGLAIQYNDGRFVLTADKSVTGFSLLGHGSSAPVPAETTNTPSSWAVESVNSAIAAGLVPEALQSKYTAATSRAEFCALAVALYEIVIGKEITERTAFSDTTDVNVEKMAALGVVNGVGDNKFSPNSSLTREQAATMLSRLASAIGKPLTEQAPTFADNPSVSSWAYDAVGQMQATGIMGGVGDNVFSPAADYTREQSIVTMLRLYDLVK